MKAFINESSYKISSNEQIYSCIFYVLYSVLSLTFAVFYKEDIAVESISRRKKLRLEMRTKKKIRGRYSL